MNTKTFRSTIFAIAVLLVPGAARAQLLFSLNPAGLAGMPGQTLTFNGTLTNAGTAPVYLNGMILIGLAPGFTFDSSLFLNNTPPSLAGGASITDDLFTIGCGPTAPGGVSVGSATIIGGVDGNAQSALATQYFLVSLPSAGGPAVPEPGPLSLLGLGLVPVFMLMVRRRRSQG